MRYTLAILVLAACGSTTNTNMMTGDCSPNLTRECVCSDQSAGVQTCSQSGHWNTCASCAGAPPPVCTPDGSSSSRANDCCSKELDDFGKCCTGNACCNSRNHSHALASACECDTGYVQDATFSASDRRCLAAPDLVPGTWNLTYWTPGAYDANMWVCVNRHPNGTTQAYGNYVHVDNTGTADAGSYGVALGIQNVSSGQFWYNSPVLVATTGTSAGSETEWLGPLCVTFSTSTLPSGTYRLAISADIDAAVAESDGTNNLVYGGTTFFIN